MESQIAKYEKAYIARIKEANSTLNVITELNPDALSIAARLDKERANGTIRGYAEFDTIILDRC